MGRSPEVWGRIIMTEELTDIEIAEKYAGESTSLAISMFNPKAEEIAK